MRPVHLSAVLFALAAAALLVPLPAAAQVGPGEEVRLAIPGDTIALAPLSWEMRLSVEGQSGVQHADYVPEIDTLDVESGATVELLFPSQPDTAYFVGWKLSDSVFTSPPYVSPVRIESGEVRSVRGCGVWWARLDPTWDRPARIARCWEGALRGVG